MGIGNDRVRIAIIGGTGFERILESGKPVLIGTPFGIPPRIISGEMGGRKVAFLPRHGLGHSVPPHRVNYRANIWALKSMGVERIVSTNAVGAINPDYRPGDIAIPADLMDFTKGRRSTFFDAAPVTHIDVSTPFCPEIAGLLLEESKKRAPVVRSGSVMAVTEGPRFETPAEIRMLRALGADLVGMTASPEAFLARELGICYCPLCFVSNMAAGMQERVTAKEVLEVAERLYPIIDAILRGVIASIPLERKCNCMAPTGGP
ncbi:MAG: S-methyl-5'-thioinosine phosphorylase [Candidatus Bathyarchaeia archaeon]